MAHASNSIDLPDIPSAIRERIVPHHRGFDIPEHLRELELEHPGILDAIARIIDMLEAYPGVESTSVDYDEDDVLFPVTVWAPTVYTGEERFRHIVILEGRAEEILRRYPELVLVSIL
jgi:hypothetical protein